MKKFIKYFKAWLAYRKNDKYDMIVWHTDVLSKKQYKETILYLDKDEMLNHKKYLENLKSDTDRLDKIVIRRPAF